jgi:hypothetical protein
LEEISLIGQLEARIIDKLRIGISQMPIDTLMETCWNESVLELSFKSVWQDVPPAPAFIVVIPSLLCSPVDVRNVATW